MRIDGFYAVGREVPGGGLVFMQTYMVGGVQAHHWGDLRYADRFLLLSNADAAVSMARELATWGEHPPSVWSVSVTASKLSDGGKA